MKITGERLPNGDFGFVCIELYERGFAPGREIWALRYTLQRVKSGNGSRLLKCYPIKGVLAGPELSAEEWSNGEIMYFVPYGPSGKPVFSKAVYAYNRQYATTKEEAIELYNEHVQEIADMYEQKKLEIMNDKI